jgi:hypothetical protein
LSLAAATLVKAFPIALLAYFVWGRRWRLLAGFLMGMVIGGVILPAAVFGCGQTLDYWSQWSDLVAKPALAADDARQDNPLYDQLLDAKKPRNQSMQSLLLSLNVKPAWAQPASGVIALVMLGLMLLAFRERRNTLLVGSAFLVWLVLIPPISESHYFGVLLLPLAVLVAIWQNDPRSTPRRLSAAVLWFFVGVALLIVPRDTSQFFKELQLLRPLCWSSLSLWCVLMVFAFRLSSDSWIQFQRNQ